MASVPESTFRILLILLAFSKLEDERGKKICLCLGVKLCTAPRALCTLGSRPTWREPSQLGRAGLMNSADEGHHLYALLFSVMKAISL